MSLSPMQHQYIRQATHRWNIKTGAVRSGKTYLDYAYILPRRILACTGQGLIALLGNTQETLSRNVLLPMRRLWGPALITTPRGDGSVTLFGHTVHLFGADKRDRVRALQGASLEYAYGDEITTWAPEVFDMLKSRLDLPTSRFDGTCNPAGPEHWFHKFLTSPADIYQQAYTIDDNPFLPPAFVQNLKGEYAGTVLYDRYILGRWSRAEDLIYRSFDPDRCCVDGPSGQVRRVAFGADIGHTNATAFVAVGEQGDGGLVALDEYYHSGRARGEAKSPLGYARDYQAFRQRVLDRHPGAVYMGVYVDPSAAGFMAQLREEGEYRVYRARNGVLAGIGTVASLLEGGRLRVGRQCRMLIQELGTYAWDAQAAAHGEDRPVKTDDHAADALRYVVHTRWGR